MFVKLAFSMIGKFGISGAFQVLCLYTPEVFPTTIRSHTPAYYKVYKHTHCVTESSPFDVLNNSAKKMDRFYLAIPLCERGLVFTMALCLSVCVSVCLSQVGVLSKRLNKQRRTIT